MLGPKGIAFDNDDVLDDNDDEDLKNDPVSQMDMQVSFFFAIPTFITNLDQGHLVAFFKRSATQNTGEFSSIVGQLTAEETMVMQKVVQDMN